MVTLSKITLQTKLILKLLGILILIFAFIKIGGAIKKQIFPTPKASPTTGFGKLPALNFPKNTVSKNFSYSIDTLSGNLPVFPDRISVYKIKPVKPDLLAFERTKETVSNLGFNPKSGAPVSQDIYQWENQDATSRKITINIFSSDFTFTSSFFATPSNQLLNIGKNDAINTAKSFLENMSLLPKDLDSEKTKTAFLFKKNYTLIPVSDAASATDIKVDLFQKDVDKLPILYQKPFSSNMSFIVENVDDKPKVVAANFIHQEITEESHQTYPLKTAETAFSKLKEGKAYIASYNGNAQSIPIKNVFLAYYLSEIRQEFLMPIVVFEGDNDFTAYVSAITDEWLSN